MALVKLSMDISILICTWNNCQRLKKTLESLQQCEIYDSLLWEVVVVDNSCTDETQEVLSGFTDKLPLVIVDEPRPGVSRAKNAGLRRIRSEFVILTDDDVSVPRDWLSLYWEAYQRFGSGYFLGGPVESEFEATPPAELLPSAPPSVRGLDWGDRERSLDRTEHFIGANWGCPRVALENAAGFDEDLGQNPDLTHVRVGEETDMMNRLYEDGMQAWYMPKTKVKHWVPASKATITHIGTRAEASSYCVSLLELREQELSYEMPTLFFGMPRWQVRMACSEWLRWKWCQLFGKYKYRSYLRFRALRGSMRAWREWHRSRS